MKTSRFNQQPLAVNDTTYKFYRFVIEEERSEESLSIKRFIH